MSIRAKLIGESSAGATIVHIYDDGKLKWSHQYFANGSTGQGYVDGMRQAYDDMVSCAEYAMFDGCDVEEDNIYKIGDEGDTIVVDNPDAGNPVDYLNEVTTGTDIVYENGAWEAKNTHMHGQNMDFIKYNKDRLPEEIVKILTLE